MQHEFLIIGGGVVGLSIAWELASRGKQVCVVDRQQLGRATSFVGAGIFPPPLVGSKHDSLEQLRTLSHRLHTEWSTRLLEETGIDNQLRQCGGIYFARNEGEAASLRGAMQWARDDGVEVNDLTADELVSLEPPLRSIAAEIKCAFHLPHEMQIRSPHHLRALTEACRKRGVEFHEHINVTSLDVQSDSVRGVVAEQRTISANEVILCCGPWITELVTPLGINMPVEPWRGQLILWKTAGPLVKRVINEGLRYLVPREDGHLLTGATVEDVGFDLATTDEAIAELRAYAVNLLPELADCKVANAWAGLRPKTPDGLPFMGRIPGFNNLSVATGHYRSGLHLSPGTAVFMADLLLHDTPPSNASAFRVSR